MHDLFQTYLAVSWRMAAVIGAWLVLRLVLRGRVSAQWLAFGWVIIFAGLVLPWRWPSSLSPLNWLPRVPVLPAETVAGPSDGPAVPLAPPAPPDRVTAAMPGAVAASPAVPVASPLAPETTTAGATGATWFTLVWAGGALLLLAARAGRWLQGLHVLSRHQPGSSRALSEVVSACARELSIPVPVLVYETDTVGTPSIWGVRQPVLLFPIGFADQLGAADLRLVVLHELGHWRRRDLWVHEVTHLARALHWFNPLVWLAVRQARDDAEAACDEFVLHRITSLEIQAYGAALLKVLGLVPGTTGRPLGLGLFGHKQKLQHRIQMIAHYQRPGAWRTLIGATAITALLAVCLTREQLHAQSTPPAAATVAALGGITTVAPTGWFRNGQNAENYTVGVDGTQSRVRPGSAYVRSIGPAMNRDFGGMMQMFDATEYLGKRLRLSAWMKTKDADKGAQLWMRIDGEAANQSLQFDNMDRRPHPMGTSDWQFCEVILDVPADAKAVAFGFFVKQTGQAWVNDAKLEVVDLTVPTTNMGTRDRPAKKLPAAPANLGFDAF